MIAVQDSLKTIFRLMKNIYCPKHLPTITKTVALCPPHKPRLLLYSSGRPLPLLCFGAISSSSMSSLVAAAECWYCGLSIRGFAGGEGGVKEGLEGGKGSKTKEISMKNNGVKVRITNLI